MLLGVVDEVSAGLVRIPVEVAAEAAVFGVVARGYDQGQVDAHVLAVEQELAELRWEHDDVAAQRRMLAEQREQQNRWRPSVRALGDRMVQLMCLAEQEAGALTRFNRSLQHLLGGGTVAVRRGLRRVS